MSSQSVTIQDSNIVGLKLMNGEEAEAVAAVVAETSPEAEIERTVAYISIEAPNRLVLDLTQVSEELGRPYDAPTFLVIMSSYTGRITVEDEQVSLTTELV